MSDDKLKKVMEQKYKEALKVEEKEKQEDIESHLDLIKQNQSEFQKGVRKVQFKDLEHIAKCGAQADRSAICAALGAGEAKTAKEVLDRKKAPGAAVLSPLDQQIAKLKDAYSRAQKSARREFVRLHCDELIELIHEISAEEEGTAEVVSFASKREAIQ